MGTLVGRYIGCWWEVFGREGQTPVKGTERENYVDSALAQLTPCTAAHYLPNNLTRFNTAYRFQTISCIAACADPANSARPNLQFLNLPPPPPPMSSPPSPLPSNPLHSLLPHAISLPTTTLTLSTSPPLSSPPLTLQTSSYVDLKGFEFDITTVNAGRNGISNRLTCYYTRGREGRSKLRVVEEQKR